MHALLVISFFALGTILFGPPDGFSPGDEPTLCIPLPCEAATRCIVELVIVRGLPAYTVPPMPNDVEIKIAVTTIVSTS